MTVKKDFDFGSWLNETMQLSDMSVIELSQMSGITKVGIRNLLHEKHTPRLDTVFKLVDSLGMKVMIVDKEDEDE